MKQKRALLVARHGYICIGQNAPKHFPHASGCGPRETARRKEQGYRRFVKALSQLAGEDFAAF